MPEAIPGLTGSDWRRRHFSIRASDAAAGCGHDSGSSLPLSTAPQTGAFFKPDGKILAIFRNFGQISPQPSAA
jgi:hypothetical protein